MAGEGRPCLCSGSLGPDHSGKGKRLKLESLKETGPKRLVWKVGETDSQAGLRRRLVSCSWVESAVGSEESQFKPGHVPCEGRRASTEPFGLV